MRKIIEAEDTGGDAFRIFSWLGLKFKYTTVVAFWRPRSQAVRPLRSSNLKIHLAPALAQRGPAKRNNSNMAGSASRARQKLAQIGIIGQS
jgi:hypothetical protein